MKKCILFSLVLLFGVFSCSNDETVVDDSTVFGKWKLVAQLVDPGDGSGTFETVDSNLELEFLGSGVLKVSNGTLCSLALDAEGNSTERYSLDDSTISADCDTPMSISFELRSGSLFLAYSCIEGCGQQFKKIP